MKAFILFASIFFSSYLISQQTTCNCCNEEYRQFDFWVGDWQVKDSTGTLLGHNHISMIEDSCALKENWTGAKGTTGTSISFYNRNTQQWHQSWIDANGGSILMDGQLTDGAMVLLSAPVENENGFSQNRTTWTPIETGVKHVWEVTQDGGKTWVVVFEGFYTPRKQ